MIASESGSLCTVPRSCPAPVAFARSRYYCQAHNSPSSATPTVLQCHLHLLDVRKFHPHTADRIHTPTWQHGPPGQRTCLLPAGPCNRWQSTACCLYVWPSSTRKAVANTIVKTGRDVMRFGSPPSSVVGCCHFVWKPSLNTLTTCATISSSNHEVDLQCAGP